MAYNSSSKLYYIYRMFSGAGDFNFNVTCSAPSYNTLNAVDGFTISSIGGGGSSDLFSIRTGQVYWWTAYVVSHSLTYGIYNNSVACDQLNLYYVEPPPINGVANKLNASTDISGNYKCQNSTQGAFTVHNDGSVGLNISARFDVITSGVRMKTANSDNGWQIACNGVCTSSCNLTAACVQVTTVDSQIAYNIPQNGSKQFWLWADFNGVVGSYSPTKGNMTTNATRYIS
jgi:hypothetical protein